MADKKKKEITMSQLAEMVAKGFNDVDKRFDGVETRLGGVESRLGRVENKLIEHDKRFSRLEYQVDEVRDITLAVFVEATI